MVLQRLSIRQDENLKFDKTENGDKVSQKCQCDTGSVVNGIQVKRQMGKQIWKNVT